MAKIMKSTTSTFGTLFITLIALVGCSKNEGAMSPKSSSGEQATFQLPAVNGGYTSFKDIEKSFRDYCSSHYQRVSVTSIELVCSANEMSHHVDDRMDPSQAETLDALATVNRYNRYARHGTLSDGFDVNWIVNVSITNMVGHSANSQEPLAVEWLCPPPTGATQIPVRTNDDLPSLAFTKYGVLLTHVTRMNLNGDKWDAEGFVGTNYFEAHIPDICEALAPANQFLSDSPISQLSWNSNAVFGTLSSGQTVPTDNPVLYSPGIKTLCDWAQNCLPKMIDAENPQPIESTVPVYLDFTVGKANLVHTTIDSYPAILIGAVLKPLIKNPTSEDLGKYKIKGQLFTFDNVPRVAVASITKADK